MNPLLATHALTGGYGDFQALFGVDIEVGENEVVALIGANGAGKSTLLKTVTGLLKAKPDQVTWRGTPIGGMPAELDRNVGPCVPAYWFVMPLLKVRLKLRMRVYSSEAVNVPQSEGANL